MKLRSRRLLSAAPNWSLYHVQHQAYCWNNTIDTAEFATDDMVAAGEFCRDRCETFANCGAFLAAIDSPLDKHCLVKFVRFDKEDCVSADW